MDYEATAAEHLWIHESACPDLYDRGMLRVFRRAEGSWLIDSRNDRYLDLCSSMWQAALGHGRTHLIDAYAAQSPPHGRGMRRGADFIADRLPRVLDATVPAITAL